MTPLATAALAAAALVVAAPAQADTLETPVADATNLASSAGWQAWNVARADGTDRLQLRRPDGTVITPAVPAFGAPVDPAIGTRGGADNVNTPASRRLSAVYSRCRGTSAVAGCDVYALDLTTMKEAKVARLATKTYSETAPSLNLGNWSVVRRGAAAGRGVSAYTERSGRLRRLTATVAYETATTTSRVAYTYKTAHGYGVQVRRSSGQGRPLTTAAGLKLRPLSPQLTRYRAGWLLAAPDATRVFTTQRFAGSGGPFTLKVEEAPRTLPAGVRSAAGDASTLFTRYLDGAGLQRIDPAIR